MSGLYHLNRASNVEIGVKCQIFVIDIFFTFDQVLQLNLGHSQGITYKDAITQKKSFLMVCTIFRSDFHVG